MVPEPVAIVPILSEGRAALVAINKDMGLGMDETDIEYYTKLFQDIGRDPTTVEVAPSTPHLQWSTPSVQRLSSAFADVRLRPVEL